MVKIFIFELSPHISEEDITFFLSEIDSSKIKLLQNQGRKDYEISLIGQILSEKVVSYVTHTPEKNILIGKTQLGKPIIKTPNYLNLDLSISHSSNYLVIGICDCGMIGVDIELLKDLDFEIFKNCLSVNEEMYINSGKEIAQRLENFYEIWTRKEACLKTLGIGLQKPLPITQFYTDEIKPRAESRHNNQQFYFSTLKENKFILSVCTTRSTVYYKNYIELTTDKLRSLVTNSEKTTLNVIIDRAFDSIKQTTHSP